MGGSSGKTNTTTQQQTVKLPQWVERAGAENYRLATEISKRPFQAYTGERVASLNPLEQKAAETLQTGMDRANTSFDTSQNAAVAATNFRPEMIDAGQFGAQQIGPVAGVANVADPNAVKDVEAGSFLSRDVNQYMNPYTQSVIDNTVSDMRRGIEHQAQGTADASRAAGAWGGSRHAVQEGVLRAEGERGIGNMAAQLRQAGFTDAANRIQADNASALQAAISNQGAGLTTEAQRLAARQGNQNAELTTQGHQLAADQSNQGANLTSDAQKLAALQGNQQIGVAGANVNLAGGNLANQTGQAITGATGQQVGLEAALGGTARGVDQANLDAQYEEFMREQGWDTEMLNTRLAALGMTPYGSTTTGTTTTPKPDSNPFLQLAGTAIGTYGALKGSDRKIKKDIKRIGKVPGTDLNQYSFKYRKGFMNHGRGPQVGLMADDVQRKVPGAVKTVTENGKRFKAVNYDKAIRARVGIGTRARG